MVTPAASPAGSATPTPDDATCLCGEPLMRNGVVVKSSWRGLICEDCERTMFEKAARART